MTISRQRLKDIAAKLDGESITPTSLKPDAVFWVDTELHMPQAKKGVYLRLDQAVLE